MKMIWHDYEFVRFDRGKFVVQCKPPTFDHAPGIVQPYFSIHDLAEQALAVLCADGHEIPPRLRVVVTPQNVFLPQFAQRVVLQSSGHIGGFQMLEDARSIFALDYPNELWGKLVDQSDRLCSNQNLSPLGC